MTRKTKAPPRAKKTRVAQEVLPVEDERDEAQGTLVEVDTPAGVAEKPQKFTLVEEGADEYSLLEEIVAAHHSTIAEAKIALGWMHEVKPDKDGHLVAGKCFKIAARERAFHDHDFVIGLNAKVWETLELKHRRAVLDHELCHVGVQTNDAGEASFYVRKHDLEEFHEIVRRHGLWRPEVEAFVNAATKKEQKDLFPEKDAAKSDAKEVETLRGKGS